MILELENIKKDLHQLHASFGNTALSSPESLVSKCEEQTTRAMKLINDFVDAKGNCDLLDYYKSWILSYEVSIKDKYYKESNIQDPELLQKLEDTHKVAFGIAQHLHKKHSQPDYKIYSVMLTELVADLCFFSVSKGANPRILFHLHSLIGNIKGGDPLLTAKASRFDKETLMPTLEEEFNKVSKRINSQDNNNASTFGI